MCGGEVICMAVIDSIAVNIFVVAPLMANSSTDGMTSKLTLHLSPSGI